MHIMTVLGPIAPDELGVTLPHEHLFCNALPEYRGNGFLMDERLAIAEVGHFRDAGGGTIVELTLDEIGRNPLALQRISEATGVNVVMGSGHYRDPYLDRQWFDQHSVDEIAELIVRDATSGVGDTGVRSGIIGEIGVDKWYISAAEERSLRAAGRAQLRTGLAISLHACRWPVGTLQLDMLSEENVPLERVIVGHVDTVPDPDYALRLVRRGCWIEFDGFGSDTEYDAMSALETIRRVADAGFLDRVLISQDVFLRSHLHAHGGNGYDFVARRLPSMMDAMGFDARDFERLSVHNPRRALSGES